MPLPRGATGLEFEIASIKPVEFPNAFYAADLADGAGRSRCVLGKSWGFLACAAAAPWILSRPNDMLPAAVFHLELG